MGLSLNPNVRQTGSATSLMGVKVKSGKSVRAPDEVAVIWGPDLPELVYGTSGSRIDVDALSARGQVVLLRKVTRGKKAIEGGSTSTQALEMELPDVGDGRFNVRLADDTEQLLRNLGWGKPVDVKLRAP